MTQTPQYDCNVIRKLIPLFVGNDLDPDEKLILIEHIKNCSRCSTLLNEYIEPFKGFINAKEELNNSISAIPPISENVINAINETNKTKEPKENYTPRRVFKFLTKAVASIMAGFFVGILILNAHHKEQGDINSSNPVFVQNDTNNQNKECPYEEKINKLGMAIKSYGNATPLVVSNVNKDSLAHNAGIFPDDVIVEINGVKIDDIAKFHKILNEILINEKKASISLISNGKLKRCIIRFK